MNSLKNYIIFFLISLFLSFPLYGLRTYQTNLQAEMHKKYFERGKVYFLQKQYDKAVQEWDPLIKNQKLDQDTKGLIFESYRQVFNANAYTIKGLAEFKNNNLETALQYFVFVTNISPFNTKAKEMIQTIHRNIKINNDLVDAGMKINERKYEEAITICKNILKIQPANKKASQLIEQSILMINNTKMNEELNILLSEGITAYSNKEYKNAKTVFDNALKLDSQNFTAIKYLDLIGKYNSLLKEKMMFEDEAEKYYQAGILFFNQGKYNESIQQLQNSLSLIPDYKESIPYIEKAKKKLKEQELAKQLDNERQILEYLNQGITYYFNSEYQMSISMLEQCLKLDPENEHAIQYLQKSKLALLQKEEEFISEDSPYYEFYIKLKRQALYYYDIAEYSESLKWWSKILKLFPANKEARETAIIITMKLDKNQADKFLASHFETGKNYYKNNEYKIALKEFEMIKKINSQYPQIEDYINKTMKYLEKPPIVKLPSALLKQYYENGLKYYKEKKYDLAIGQWNNILKDNSADNPFRVNAIVNINKIQRKMKFSSAETKEPAPETDNKNAEMVNKHYLKGVAFYVKGRYQEAVQEWKIVLQYDPDNAKTKNNLEKCERRLQFAK